MAKHWKPNAESDIDDNRKISFARRSAFSKSDGRHVWFVVYWSTPVYPTFTNITRTQRPRRQPTCEGEGVAGNGENEIVARLAGALPDCEISESFAPMIEDALPTLDLANGKEYVPPASVANV